MEQFVDPRRIKDFKNPYMNNPDYLVEDKSIEILGDDTGKGGKWDDGVL